MSGIYFTKLQQEKEGIDEENGGDACPHIWVMGVRVYSFIFIKTLSYV